MDAVNNFLPSPEDRATVVGKDPKNGQDVSLPPDPDGPLTAYVLKPSPTLMPGVYLCFGFTPAL